MYTCQKADEYIEKNRVDRADKPEFHLTTPVGWLNDPNGFSIYGGKTHLFYQFHPYSTEWGPMHWGHSSSKDFIKWEELPTALAPDSEFDSFGCFSGTAIENDGKHVLFYTGVVEEKLADGTKNVIQNQCMAVGDGISYEKISSNPVVDGKIMPALTSIDGMGEKAAQQVEEAAKGEPFTSLENFRNRTKAPQACIEKMKELGIMGDLSDTDQLSFDFL